MCSTSFIFLFKNFCHFIDRESGEMTRNYGMKMIQGMICTCFSHNTMRLEHMSSFFLYFFLPQYIFTCLHGGLTPQLTVVHHSAIIKYQEEQGGLSNQVSRSRAQSKPPPLPLKRVRWHFYTGTRSVINRGTTYHVFFL